MGKRTRYGGRSSSSSSSLIILRQRIVSLKLDGSFDVDAVADHLRSLHPDYSRLALRPFTVQVRKTLDFFHRRNKTLENDGDDDEDRCRKTTTRKADESEERLLAAESDHVRKQRLRKDWNPNASSLVWSDDSTSISESDDAVSEAKMNPEFDLTKSMLRDNYSKKSKFEEKDEPNMEIDAVDEKKTMTMGSSQSRSESEITALKDEYLTKGKVAINEGPRFRDIGGMKEILEKLKTEVIVPFCFPQLPRRLGVRPMSGILLHGPPGCGKSKLVHAIANETGVPFYMISATEIVSGVSGASEENIRDLFKKAYRTAPSIVFIDEIDAIASKRENLQREMERRIVTQLMTCMGESYRTLKSTDADFESETSDRKSGCVLVIGATNRPDAIDQALRRPGRFDREIALGVPDENARLEILSVLSKELRLEGEFNLMKIARFTPGFVGGDLSQLVDFGGNLAMKRIIDRRKSEFKGEKIDEWWRQPWSPEDIESLFITMSDFEAAIQMVQPSSTREGFSSIPSTRWEDVGGLKSLREEFELYIVQRIKKPEDYEEFGVNMAVGFLLYGPPGCGKTLIAKAVANEAGANFIHIKGAELLDKYVGESELAIRTIFSRARMCSPCILFFDEVDTLTTMRGKEGGSVVERVLAQLLIELDGADQRQGVYVIGATNRLEVMDPAILRPGRFGTVLYAPVPTGEERGLILKALARKKPVAADVDLDAFGRKEACHNLTGADLSKLMEEAAIVAMKERRMARDSGRSYAGPPVIETSHFDKALLEIAPSVSEEQMIHYETLLKKYRRN